MMSVQGSDMASCRDGGNGGGGGGPVVTELTHIKELLAQLEAHLGGPRDYREVCRRLTSQMRSHAERSIGLVTSSSSAAAAAAGKRAAADAGLADVPSRTGKKRKMAKKTTHQVRAVGGGEVPVDDGHSWRKYGQKEILGAKYPRAYYRCTHRHSQGCAATKQVQRTDRDPALFDVFYLGAHTCAQRAAAAAATQPPEQNSSLSSTTTTTTLAVKAAGVEPAELQDWAPLFFLSPSSTPGSDCQLAPERSPLISAPSTSGANWGASPATSDSNHAASFPPFDAAAGDAARWLPARSEFQEVVSALVAVTSGSPAPELLEKDFCDEFLDLDTIFDV